MEAASSGRVPSSRFKPLIGVETLLARQFKSQPATRTSRFGLSWTTRANRTEQALPPPNVVDFRSTVLLTAGN